MSLLGCVGKGGERSKYDEGGRRGRGGMSKKERVLSISKKERVPSISTREDRLYIFAIQGRNTFHAPPPLIYQSVVYSSQHSPVAPAPNYP